MRGRHDMRNGELDLPLFMKLVRFVLSKLKNNYF